MSESEKGTFFYNTDGEKVGSASEILPISLRKGMKITIHGYEETFEVVDWSYHHGHPDEESGLKIFLTPVNKEGSEFKVTKLRL